MIYIATNTAFRAAARQHDNASPVESDEAVSEREETLRAAIRTDSQFIAEALQEDCTELVAAIRASDGQHALDAISDMVDSWLESSIRNQLNRRDYFSSDYPRTYLDALENIARVWGVQ